MKGFVNQMSENTPCAALSSPRPEMERIDVIPRAGLPGAHAGGELAVLAEEIARLRAALEMRLEKDGAQDLLQIACMPEYRALESAANTYMQRASSAPLPARAV